MSCKLKRLDPSATVCATADNGRADEELLEEEVQVSVVNFVHLRLVLEVIMVVAA